MALGFNPDDVMFHRLADAFDDELIVLTEAINRAPRVMCDYNFYVNDNQCCATLALDIEIVFEPGAGAFRLKDALTKIEEVIP